jgi:hypothetical protein
MRKHIPYPYFHPLRSEFRKEFCKMSLEGGSGGTCSLKVPPEAEHLLSKPKVEVRRGTPNKQFSSP